MDKTVVELFAGVGGFRVGLNHIKRVGKNGKALEHGDFNIVWADQWEPSTRAQSAYDCYALRFGDKEISNEDITKVNKETIPEHTLLVGGFPCQDYSVARSLSNEKGIEGKKGVLWWQINEILQIKRPPFVLLENVDRLIKSPSSQRGRDFGIMLKCFNNLGYFVEWRTINAADYGMPQRRRRIYIFAYRSDTRLAQKLINEKFSDILTSTGVIARTFKIEPKLERAKEFNISWPYKDIVDFSNNFSQTFENSGCMIGGAVYTAHTTPIFINPTPLSTLFEKDADEQFYLTDEQIKKYQYLRGSKKVLRHSRSGFEYYYSEGAMSEYDEESKPGRTMLTSEGKTNRSTHIVKDPSNKKLRVLTPKECERLNQFPDNWTDTGMSLSKRYFMMGNALVCGIIEKFGNTISKIIDEENEE